MWNTCDHGAGTVAVAANYYHAHPDMLHDDVLEVVVDNNNPPPVSSGNQSPDNNCISFYENLDSGFTAGSSLDIINSNDKNSEPLLWSFKTVNLDKMKDLSCNEGPSLSQHSLDNLEDELRRHKEGLKKAMELYHAARKEAQISKKKLNELQELYMKQKQGMKEVESEKATSKEANETAQRLEEQVVEKRVLKAQVKALMEADARQKFLDALRQSHAVLKLQSLFNIFIVLYLSYLCYSSFK